MASRDMIVGLDLGTTKISTIIAEVDENGVANIVGVGNCNAKGMQRGVVINIDKTIEAIEKSIEEAERMAGVQVASVFAGIAGDHIRSVNSKGVIAVTRTSSNERTSIITKKDIERVLEAAKAVNLPMDREVLHVLPQEFTVDDQSGIIEPIGMAGVRLEADVHIITGAVASAQNIFRCVKRAGISVADLVLEPLASSYSVLTPEERDLGVGILDLGGGTTDIAVFEGGAIRHTSVIGLGGENVTKDLGVGLQTSFENAETVKLESGHCYAPLLDGSEEIEIPGIGGRPPKVVRRMEIVDYVQPRMEEIFELASAEVRKAGAFKLMRSGIVLTGGASQIEGSVELAEAIFGTQVRIGYPTGLGGLMESARSPKYSTAVGLVLYGLHEGERADLLRGDDTTIFQKIGKRMKGWFDEFF